MSSSGPRERITDARDARSEALLGVLAGGPEHVGRPRAAWCAPPEPGPRRRVHGRTEDRRVQLAHDLRAGPRIREDPRPRGWTAPSAAVAQVTGRGGTEGDPVERGRAALAGRRLDEEADTGGRPLLLRAEREHADERPSFAVRRRVEGEGTAGAADPQPA